jgi:hypothetical protein
MIRMDAHLSGHIVSEKRDRFRGFDAVVAFLRCKTCTDNNHVKQPSTPVENPGCRTSRYAAPKRAGSRVISVEPKSPF